MFMDLSIETLRMSRTNVIHVILGIMRHPGRLDCTQFGVLLRHMAENVQTRQTLFHEIKKPIYLGHGSTNVRSLTVHPAMNYDFFFALSLKCLTIMMSFINSSFDFQLE